MATDRVFRHHWLRRARPAIGTFLALTVFLILTVKYVEKAFPWPLLLLSAAFLAWTFWRWLNINAFKVMIDHEGRVCCHRGIMGPDICLPLLFARSVFYQTLLGRVFNYGTLTLLGQPEYKLDFLERFSEIKGIIEAGRQEVQPKTPWSNNTQPILVILPLLQHQRPYRPRTIQDPGTVVDGEFKVLRTWGDQEQPQGEKGWSADLFGVPVLDDWLQGHG